MTTKPQINYEQVLIDAGMPVTTDAITEQFQAQVNAEGLITNTSRMSPFWRLINVIVTTPVLWLKDVLIDVVMTNMFLATASGAFLDVFAWGVNVSRKPATAAGGAIRFFKLNAGQAVLVPAGTVIQTERINGQVYSVRVTVDTTIPAGSASGLVPVTATSEGGAFNLAPGYYRILLVGVDGIERAENEEGWLIRPGADQESDDDLRDRCRNQYNLVGNYHTDAIYRSMIAAVAGLSIDRIFFLHDAPRGAGTANAYLLLDSGVISAPFITAVNDYITAQGNHGHGDDMQCMAMPETRHDLTVTLYVNNLANVTTDELTALRNGCDNLVRCAFRENSEYDVKRTWPYDRFSFSNLGRELHREFALIDSLAFSLGDIVSDLSVPRLSGLTVVIENA
ncbi:baseplate J/gp47 family protein [Pectobacterium carotovorum subsp. carotovorum]|uniref:baseplate J/gp47 family protein n=1 Tax=Pectobacterium carotovorum TaxID=554 RepID=UPI0023664146|nr:baseplate J/gp47 family protein [Pectobacterium carotovorum]WDF97984.1 baseplate J/gp47 family protein [Pectobacterium carotovorum subsp. carotovorum]